MVTAEGEWQWTDLRSRLITSWRAGEGRMGRGWGAVQGKAAPGFHRCSPSLFIDSLISTGRGAGGAEGGGRPVRFPAWMSSTLLRCTVPPLLMDVPANNNNGAGRPDLTGQYLSARRPRCVCPLPGRRTVVTVVHLHATLFKLTQNTSACERGSPGF